MSKRKYRKRVHAHRCRYSDCGLATQWAIHTHADYNHSLHKCPYCDRRCKCLKEKRKEK